MQSIQGLREYKNDEIVEIVMRFIDELKSENRLEGLDFVIRKVSVFGSRLNGKARENSDLDVNIEYCGSAREDDLFNALNDKLNRLKIENIVVDFFPVKSRFV